jgi:hypothetical protein
MEKKEIRAFPREFRTSPEDSGMTLRDWFAGQALVGLLSRPQVISSGDPCDAAYSYADSMLKCKKEIENETIST